MSYTLQTMDGNTYNVPREFYIKIKLKTAIHCLRMAVQLKAFGHEAAEDFLNAANLSLNDARIAMGGNDA